jgi:hypothetical protein
METQNQDSKISVSLRVKFSEPSADDIQVTISEKSFDYLMSLTLPTARVSTYLDRDFSQVAAKYAELFINTDCPYRYRITQMMPGSKTRSVRLPDEMKSGEQITLNVDRVLLENGL